MWKYFFRSYLHLRKELAQFKVLLNCAANLDPEVNMKGCEDFLTVILHEHIVAAANKVKQGTI